VGNYSHSVQVSQMTHTYPTYPTNRADLARSLPEGLQQYAITDQERQKIAQIKERLHKDGLLTPRYDDVRICRFLRREKEVAPTEAMIRREMKWRYERRPDEIFANFPHSKYFKFLIEYWPGAFHGVDRYGVAMYVERLGQIDLNFLFTAVPFDVLIDFHIYCMERNDRIVTESCIRLGAPVGFVYIMDLLGLSMRHYSSQAIDIVKVIQSIDDNYYPEALRKVVILNAPSIFSIFWKVAKLIMHKQSVAKVTNNN